MTMKVTSRNSIFYQKKEKAEILLLRHHISHDMDTITGSGLDHQLSMMEPIAQLGSNLSTRVLLDLDMDKAKGGVGPSFGEMGNNINCILKHKVCNN